VIAYSAHDVSGETERHLRYHSPLMRLTASWLLFTSIALLFADAYTAMRMRSDCCCAGMSNMCPLKHPVRHSCNDGRTCSLEKPDTGASARYLRALDARDPSTLTETPSRGLLPLTARTFAPSDSRPLSLNTPPEIPPPRSV
jgi:hypothetical protein